MEWSELIRDTWQTSLVFISLLLFTRLLGKTQIAQLTFYQYVSGITIGSIAGTVAASEQERVWSHFYDLVLFVALTFLLSQITIRNRSLRKLIDGSPTVVIENGRILEQNMRNMRYDLDELICQLRINGILDPSQVQYAVVETTGDLSVIKKTALQALTKSDAGLEQPDAQYPVELILDGQVVAENLAKKQLSADWLAGQLRLRGFAAPDQITYAVLDSKGHLFISPRDQLSR